MVMPELTKEQKAALVVSRMARTVAHHEAAHAPKKLRTFAARRTRRARKGVRGSSRTICQSAALCLLTAPRTRQF